MSSILALIIPDDATDAQLLACLDAMDRHRSAVDGNVKVASNIPAAKLLHDEAADNVNDVVGFFAKQESTPSLPSVEEMDATGDPTWLAAYVSEHNELPTVTDENAWHILAALKGQKQASMPDAVVTLKRQANAARARYAGKVKNGNGHSDDTDETPSNDPLAFLVGNKPAASEPAQPAQPAQPAAPVIDVSKVQLASELTPELRQVVSAWGETLTERNKALVLAWAHGDTNPATGKPLTLDEVNTHVTGAQVATLRRKVAAALK